MIEVLLLPAALLLLPWGCAGLEPRSLPPSPSARAMPPDQLKSVLKQLRATQTGEWLLELLDGVPIEASFVHPLAVQGRLAAYDGGLYDGDGRLRARRFLFHPNLEAPSSQEILLPLVFAHELGHAYLESFPEERQILMSLSEIFATSLSMRVWIELDPQNQKDFPEGVLKDFEGKDVSESLREMRRVYQTGLEEFEQLVRARYHRFCESHEHLCGDHMPLGRVSPQDPLRRKSWEEFIRLDRTFRLRHLHPPKENHH